MPRLGTFGNQGRNTLRTPGVNNFDFALMKNFPLWNEQSKLQFRGEFCNIFNHPQFLNVGNTLGSATFGRLTDVAPPRIIQFGLRLSF